MSELTADFKNSEIICLGLIETWLNTNMPNHLINIPGFNLVRLDREATKRGGGILMYIREDLTWDLLEPMYNISNKNIELLNVVIHRKCLRSICVSAIYLPPKGSMADAVNHLDSVADYMATRNSEWIIGG